MSKISEWPQVGVRIPPDLYEELTRLAVRNDRSRAGETRIALAKHVESATGRTGSVDRAVQKYERKKARGEFDTPAALVAAREAALRVSEATE